MRIAAFDTETHLVQPGLLTPPLVCGSVAEALGRGKLLTREESLTTARRLLEDSEVTISGAFIAYDFGVLANEDPSLLKLIFKAYEEERVVDILVLEALHAIAEGHLFLEPDGVTSLKSNGKRTNRYSLDVLVHLVLGRKDAKENDFWRKRYALLESVPHAEWPWEAKQYPIDDVENTLEVTLQRFGGFRNSADLPAQCETAWALHLGACWGIRTDPERVVQLKARAKELYTEYVKHFASLGFYKPRGSALVEIEPAEKTIFDGEPGVRAVDMDLSADAKAVVVESDEESDIDPDGFRKDSAAVARAVALAYGCVGECVACRGAGKVPSRKVIPCRGAKLRGRYQGCLKALGCVCGESGVVTQFGSLISCKRCFGTGLDVDSSENLPRTDKGGIRTDRDTLSESGDENLMALADNKPTKILKTYIPFLEQGTTRPINLRPNVLVETGRTSYEGVIHQTPRGGLKGVYSVRECYVARAGRLFGSTDYSAIELCALAQCCLWMIGYSEMANVINKSKDPGSLHTEFAAKMVGCTPEEMKARVKADDKIAKGFRQAAKPCFHPDTEILTRTGWKRIADLTMEDEVAGAKPTQDSKTVEIEWTKPLALTRRSASELLHLKNEGIDLRVTPEHRMLTWNDRLEGNSRTGSRKVGTNWKVVPASEFGKQRGWVNAGILAGGDRVVDERLLRIAVAVQADGTYAQAQRSATEAIRLGFSKSRKIKRLMSLLRSDEYELSSTRNGKWQRTTVFKLSESLTKAIKALLTLEKTLPWWWTELTPELRGVVLDEVQYWDGSRAPNWRMHQFYSSISSNIDVLQAMATLTGRKSRAAVGSEEEENHKTCWRLTLRDKSDTRGENVKVTKITHDGDVVCLSVPSSFVVVRDGGVPVVVGQCNFGFPGGMGAAKFVLTNRKENAGTTESPSGRKFPGIRFCVLVDGARECGTTKVTEWKNKSIPPTCKQCLEVVENNLKPAWFEQWPEVKEYLAWVNEYIEVTQGSISSLSPWMEINEAGRVISHRERGNVEYCAAANHAFQSLNADGSKAALRAVTREAYTDESSVLFKSQTRVPFFMHDEIFSEHDETLAHLAVQRISEIMIREMKLYMPDVHVVAEPCLMIHWSKDAEPIFGVDCTPRPELGAALLAAGWKADKEDSRSEADQATSQIMKGHVRFRSRNQADKFAAEVRFRGGVTTEPKLVPWFPKEKS